ncbi:MAG TPA: transketolase [bacterium]|nr:transketolase [bacterium]
MNQQVSERCLNTLRFLAVDAVQKARSGHPGAPLGMAAMAFCLWDRFLKHNPADPQWLDRDRFILSAGHASSLLYGLLHLTGYDLSLDDIKNFRQWGSKTPGHPEYPLVPGVEMTTGPLGQGFAHGVGMAIAERWLAARYNRPGHAIVDHYTYALVSDGDLQEGVSHEAAGLAGKHKLGKLIYLYDDNDIQIEGSTDKVFPEDVAQRFAALGWQTIGPVDGFDLEALDAAIREAQAETEKPSLIICKTIIGYGSPLAGSEKCHGAPLGEANVTATKEALGWPLEPAFFVPDDVREYMGRAVERGRQAQAAWDERLAAYRLAHPDLAARFVAQMSGEFPTGWDDELDALFAGSDKPVATRNASGKVLNAVVKKVDWLMGGSADLGPSNKTYQDGLGDFGEDGFAGPNLAFGVREHAMGSLAGGLALHGGVIPYTGTFLIFTDYMRPPMRLAALMGLRVIYVYSHDSIALGEDGPTHQPIEQIMQLRLMPNVTVVRPADGPETVEAWRVALTRREGPTVLLTSRQDLPAIDRTRAAAATGLRRGAYVLWESAAQPELIFIATGSEVHLALEVGQKLAAEGEKVRVVSMPSWELFAAQDAAYRESVLPAKTGKRLAVEAGLKYGWERWVGPAGAVIGLEHYGDSAPWQVLYEKYGFTVENIEARARQLLAE